MSVPKNGATTSSASAKGDGFPTVDEAVNSALEQVGNGGATETATDDTEDREDETTGEESDETTEGDNTESEEGDDEQSGDDGEGGDGLMTADDFDDLKPGQQVNVPLKSVRPEDRAYVKAVKQGLSRGFQAAADARTQRNGDDRTTQTPSKPQEKVYTRDELFDMAQEGPEGFERAQQIHLEQSLPAALKKLGVDPERMQKNATSDVVDDAIEIAIGNDYVEFQDAGFRQQVAKMLKTNDITARRFQRALQSGDPEQIAPVLEAAAEKVRGLRYKQTEAARNKTKTTKETATAKEKSSVAATSTTRSSSPVKKGPVTVDASVDSAIKAVGGNVFR